MIKLNLNTLLGISVVNFFICVGIFSYLNRAPQVLKAEVKVVGLPVSTAPVQVAAPSLTVSSTQKIKQPPAPTFREETLAEQVSKHSASNNCWIIYSNHAYDITSYFGSHPGGDDIMAKYCGQDATAAFDSKDKSPISPHSETASKLLSQYLVR